MALSYRGRPSTGLDYLNSDTTLTKLFVGGLAWETQSPTLHSYFRQFGEILEAVVITDKNTGRSKGYGFVTFRDPESAKRACADPSPIIDGRRANCNLAALGRPPPAFPIDYRHLIMEVCLLVEHILEILATNSHIHMAFSKGSYIRNMVLALMVQKTSIHRVLTTLMLVSSTFQYMGYLEQLIRLCILTMLVKMFQVARVIQHCRVMHCLVTKLCSLVYPLSIQSPHQLFKHFNLHILQV
ncbi:uncharacterized protein LOC108219207 isoform X2 [Daucus carota subsp. sativus]|uniref:uncharacterized protein LOC108219207 isoform X2 n=1 Tax=Daucus carota subsp. sativus TaxID=79200 RepID=UPI0007F0193D|nr:PREDICTED: RNA-binding protein 24 isoform X2 [Daucus carota subsp. sativus]